MRNITGTVIGTTGSAASGIDVDFSLVDASGQQTSSFISATGERIAGSFTATTDVNGAFTIALIETTLLSDTVYYRVETAILGDVPFTAPLAEGLTDIDWLELKGFAL